LGVAAPFEGALARDEAGSSIGIEAYAKVDGAQDTHTRLGETCLDAQGGGKWVCYWLLSGFHFSRSDADVVGTVDRTNASVVSTRSKLKRRSLLAVRGLLSYGTRQIVSVVKK
jgi:hypothetical protein